MPELAHQSGPNGQNEPERSSTSNRSPLRNRRQVAALIAIGIIVGVIVVIALGSGSGLSSGQLGPFAGYLAVVKQLRSISGSWTVARVLPGAQDGTGSTWIGAQGSAGQAVAFIQAGVTDLQPSAGNDQYEAFWSDPTHHFHPVKLFAVTPGDHITARLVLRDQQWRVSVDDLTDGRHAHFSTAEQADGTFAIAQWTQEDPSTSTGSTNATTVRAPYAMTAPVQFAALKLNGRPPSPARAQTQWMSLPATDLAPTALTHDTFSVTQRKMSPAGRRFLSITLKADAAVGLFRFQAFGNLPVNQTPLSTAKQRFQIATNNVNKQLTSTKWPANSRAAIADFTTANRQLQDVTEKLAPEPSAHARRAWIRIEESDTRAQQAAARAVGAPDDIGGSSIAP